MSLNPFRTVTEEEKKQREADQKVIDDKIKALALLGQKIIASPDGVKYRAELEKQRDEIIKIAIRTVDPDPIRDAFFCRAVFNKLGVLYGFLDSVDKDAKSSSAAQF